MNLIDFKEVIIREFPALEDHVGLQCNTLCVGAMLEDYNISVGTFMKGSLEGDNLIIHARGYNPDHIMSLREKAGEMSKVSSEAQALLELSISSRVSNV